MADADQETAKTDRSDQLLELREDFLASATPLERLSAKARSFLAVPLVAVGVGLFAIIWAFGNYLAPRFGLTPIDPPPFEAMQYSGTMAALMVTVLILAGQRREDEAERRRSQLTLHLSAQSEQKIAKLIELLEEQRRHNPLLPDRDDKEAERMALPAEPKEILDRLTKGQ